MITWPTPVVFFMASIYPFPDLSARESPEEEGVHGHLGEADGRSQQRAGQLPTEVLLPGAAKRLLAAPSPKAAGPAGSPVCQGGRQCERQKLLCSSGGLDMKL